MLMSTAFFIVIERKILGMAQLRHGPNKPSLKGLLVFLADGVKLFTKGLLIPNSANKMLFITAPVFMFVLSFGVWIIFPSPFPVEYYKYSVLYFLALSGTNVFAIILVGWSSNSSYAMLGSMRAIAQSISYEVAMFTVFMCPLLLIFGFEFQRMLDDPVTTWAYCSSSLVMWFISILAETNRAPFDFVEGESELVAGFHVEVGGGLFALIALAEYGAIIGMSVFTAVLFFGGVDSVLLLVVVLSVCYLFILVRAATPRYRYDMLMDFCWTKLLPIAMCNFLFIMVW
uniref:NADH-ubiquinone oxidoreductase chain 1 n=1 Tax=Tridacna crocea TaxID=80833 RepID=A0A6B9PGY7_TRICC|nr:NADH dehydrogenase subunit 1 [Tridacna crocea]QHD44981.1 NADH dehydrogenase subunit 1 [Tridacna crocea]QRV60344.1 NADH dehydrogenase subunit 1 [Tridacna crocea]